MTLIVLINLNPLAMAILVQFGLFQVSFVTLIYFHQFFILQISSETKNSLEYFQIFQHLNFISGFRDDFECCLWLMMQNIMKHDFAQAIYSAAISLTLE